MNAILLKDERTELAAFCEAILEVHGTSICREEEIIRNKREANHRKWEAKLRRASGCDGSHIRGENEPLNRAAGPPPLRGPGSAKIKPTTASAIFRRLQHKYCRPDR
jgi:hypothetical protein